MEKMKFRGHETFSIRKMWICKGLKGIVSNPGLFFDTSASAMDYLGIGSNMIKSLRYWLVATGLVKETMHDKRRFHELTEAGRIVYKYDFYAEEMGTLWLLHYNLVKDAERATSWYYFFNFFHLAEFSKEDFFTVLQNELNMKGIEVSERSIDDDFNCIINTYVPRSMITPGKENPEDNIECPLGELNLVNQCNRKEKTYRKVCPITENIPEKIFLGILIDFARERREVTLSELKNGVASPGMVFNLDMVGLLEMLTQLEKKGYVDVVRTSGLDVVRIKVESSFLDCVNEYYKELMR